MSLLSSSKTSKLHNRENFGVLLESIIGNLNSIISAGPLHLDFIDNVKAIPINDINGKRYINN